MERSREPGTALGPSRRSVFWVLLASLALLAAACGDDDDATADPEPEATATDTAAESAPEPDDAGAEEDATEEEAAAPADGEPIKVMVTGTIEAPALSLPSVPAGAQLAVERLNAEGGIDGRPIELIVCNDELNPNVATTCAQTAIAEGVVALVGGLSLFDPAVVPLLESANIPWIGNASATLATSPVVFPIAADGASVFSGAGAIAVLDGCESPGVILSATAAPEHGPDVAAGIEAFGGTVAIEVQGNGPDFAAVVAAAVDAGAGCLIAAVTPQEVPGVLQANAGRLPIYTADGTLPPPLLAALGEAADGTKLVSGFLLPGSGDEGVLALLEASEELTPGVGMDNFWFTGYVGVNLVAETLRGADDVSPDTVLANMSAISGFDTGVGPVLDFTTSNPNPALSQVVNTEMYLYEIVGGQYTLAQEETIDMQPALDIITR